MKGVWSEGRRKLEEGPAQVPFSFLEGDVRCDTSVVLATCVSHVVPENCRNGGKPLLRWPYFQNISTPGQTFGHCPFCMAAFPTGQDVPEHGVV